MLRLLAVSNINLLNLKQIFVRYMSHEIRFHSHIFFPWNFSILIIDSNIVIRSPLNIVHAGLDIILSEVKTNQVNWSSSVVISSESAEMLEHIYSASQATIDILNDLLQYEHIDSGAFKLELCWLPVARFLEKKLDWAKVLAAKKNIQLAIEDRTSAACEENSGAILNPQVRSISIFNSNTFFFFFVKRISASMKRMGGSHQRFSIF